MFRPTLSNQSRRIARKLSCVAGTTLAALGCSSAPAGAVTAAAAAPATCAGQTFSQPFLEYEDSRFYTLSPGGEFNGPSEGWTYTGGAGVISGTRPSGSTGGMLNLPAGSIALSAPVCVTRAYPIARVWVRAATGTKKVKVYVSYAGTRSETEPKAVGTLVRPSGIWTLSEFRLDPHLAGSEVAAHNVTFVFEAGAKTGETQLYDLYIDPRMR